MTDITTADLNYINSIIGSGQNYYMAYDRLATYLPAGSEQRFWFEQASIINRIANGMPVSAQNNLSGTFILTYSKYGLLLDGVSANLSSTSNAIALNVLSDIVTQGQIPSMGAMLNNDIGAALDIGGQTIGGWGGAFYYWNLPSGGSGGTVGSVITADPVQYEKFILSSAVATIAVIGQEGYELLNGLGGATSEAARVIQTVFGADLPPSIQAEILEVVIDTMTYGQIGGSIDNFGAWTYDRSSGRFYTVSNSGDAVYATPAEQAYLEARRDVRLNLHSNDLNGSGLVLVS